MDVYCLPMLLSGDSLHCYWYAYFSVARGLHCYGLLVFRSPPFEKEKARSVLTVLVSGLNA